MEVNWRLASETVYNSITALLGRTMVVERLKSCHHHTTMSRQCVLDRAMGSDLLFQVAESDAIAAS